MNLIKFFEFLIIKCKCFNGNLICCFIFLIEVFMCFLIGIFICKEVGEKGLYWGCGIFKKGLRIGDRIMINVIIKIIK